MDELAVPNRSGNTTSPDNYLRDADDKEYGYAKPVVFINGYFVQKFLMDFVDLAQVTETVVNSDGYGNLLSSSGEDAFEANVNNTWYFIIPLD